ncbi:MAG: M23 family metallopeptidase, partial [Leptospiraceae bacterium]|nr:M23 family metallopeptidase [Leptospiraceae bacterium]
IKSRLYYFAGESEADNEDGQIKIIEYTVRNGDTLSTIALQHRVPIGVIAETSKIKVHSTLRPGQKLQIPNRPGLLYSIKPGDTLAALAEHYSVKMEDVAKDNPDLANLDLIPPGTQVFLPNAKIPVPPPTWLRPLIGGRLTSGFGWRKHPLYNHRHLHAGIDIAVYHKGVRAVRDGEVIFAGWLGSYGNAVVIRHPGGFKSLYAHLSSIKVRQGQYVKAGHYIAITGNTGLSTGPHLHFELIQNGRPINPRRYIRF